MLNDFSLISHSAAAIAYGLLGLVLHDTFGGISTAHSYWPLSSP